MQHARTILVAELDRPGVDDASSQRMQRQDGHVGGAIANFAGRLASKPTSGFRRERHDQYGRWIEAALVKKVSNASGEHRGFAAARSGHDGHWPCSGGNCQLLL